MYHPLMLLAGMLLLFHSVYLPSTFFILYLCCLAAWCYSKKQNCFGLFSTFVFGYCWAWGYAVSYQTADLPAGLVNQQVQMSACIFELRNRGVRYQRIGLVVDQIQFEGKKLNYNARVSLANYNPLPGIVTAGWCGKFLATLKPVHGRLNRYGFDYEAWAYVNRIKANGTLKQTIAIAPGDGATNAFFRFRSKLIAELIVRLGQAGSTPLIASLALGDRDMIDTQHWDVLRHSGTGHLLAISGLHIGLVFWMTSGLVSMMWRRIGALPLIIPAQKMGWLSGLIISAVYLVLTGLPLSGRRAWVMLACCVVCWIGNKKTELKQSLIVGLVVILLLWPDSVLSIGFWFSFSAVAFIVVLFCHTTHNLRGPSIFPRYRIVQSCLNLIRMQCLICLVMIPLVVVYFGEFSLVSPVANLIAVPVISLLVLPLVLMGLMLQIVGFDQISLMVFSPAQTLLDWLYEFLKILVETRWSWYAPPIITFTGWYLLMVALFMFFVFRLWPGKWVFLVCLLSVLINPAERPKKGELELTVFDVGQGLAIWLRSRHHNILVDTGFGIKNGFNYFDSVIYPALKASGVSRLDAVIISHGDSDHAGGLNALKSSDLEVGVIYHSQITGDSQRLYCKNTWAWKWDDVQFEFLSQRFVRGDNNQSCVLKVSGLYGSVLLPGDIERESESKLVQSSAAALNADILVVPHHGSRTSSSRSFVSSVDPDIAVFSTGYLNRYRHPAPEVVQRYLDRGVKLFNTACHGQLTFKLTQSGISHHALRQSRQQFWRHRCD